MPQFIYRLLFTLFLFYLMKSRMEIEEIIASGENYFVEFKELKLGSRGVISPNPKSFAAEMVAFANAHGGTLLLGVDDHGILTGVPLNQIKEIEEWVINVASNNCKPSIEPILSTINLLDKQGCKKTIVVVEIPRGLYVHATISGGSHMFVWDPLNKSY